MHLVTFASRTRCEESQGANGLIWHDVVEATQLSKHLQTRFFLSAGVRGQTVPLPPIPLQLEDFDLTQVLEGTDACVSVTSLISQLNIPDINYLEVNVIEQPS